MSDNQNDKRVVQLINSGKFNDDWDELEEYREELGLRNIEIVPRIDRVQTGIQMTRDAFSSAWFDETGCAQGLKHLDMYRKEWDAQRVVENKTFLEEA